MQEIAECLLAKEEWTNNSHLFKSAMENSMREDNWAKIRKMLSWQLEMKQRCSRRKAMEIEAGGGEAEDPIALLKRRQQHYFHPHSHDPGTSTFADTANFPMVSMDFVGCGGGNGTANNMMFPETTTTTMVVDDEFMELQELNSCGGLSDGDICLSRQLAATIDDGMDTSNDDGTGQGMEDEDNNDNGDEEEENNQKKQQLEDTVQQDQELGQKQQGPIDEFLPSEAVEQFLLGMDDGEQNINISSQQQMSGELFLGDFSNRPPPSSSHSHQTESSAASSRCSSALPSGHHHQQHQQQTATAPNAVELPPPPPIVISPQDVDHISVTLEKNQQCACADCGKLFNSVWYLKQHAVKHSNDRPFKCRFCMKTYKFRSNLYQHKCPERNRLLLAGEFNLVGHPYRRRAYNRSADKKHQKEQQKAALLNGASTATAPISINTSNNAMFGGTAAETSFSTGNAAGSSSANGCDFLASSSQQQQDQHQQQFLQTNQQGLLMMGASQMDSMLKNNSSYSNDNSLNCLSAGFFSSQMEENGRQIVQQTIGQQQQMPGGFECQWKNISSSSNNSRERPPLTPELIEQYLRRNKHRVFNCRKCKLYFPSSEYFSRHMAYHSELEAYKFVCAKCPERFQTDQGLRTHQLQHSEQSPHFCLQCQGVFRSALALRRHKDNWRQCQSPSPDMNFPWALSPLDQFSFGLESSDLDELANGPSEEEEEEKEERTDEAGQREEEHKKETLEAVTCREQQFGPQMLLGRKTTRDSGYQGSDTLSPAGSHSPTMDDASSSHSQEQNVVNCLAATITNKDEDSMTEAKRSQRQKEEEELVDQFSWPNEQKGSGIQQTEQQKLTKSFSLPAKGGGQTRASKGRTGGFGGSLGNNGQSQKQQQNGGSKKMGMGLRSSSSSSSSAKNAMASGGHCHRSGGPDRNNNGDGSRP